MNFYVELLKILERLGSKIKSYLFPKQVGYIHYLFIVLYFKIVNLFTDLLDVCLGVKRALKAVYVTFLKALHHPGYYLFLVLNIYIAAWLKLFEMPLMIDGYIIFPTPLTLFMLFALYFHALDGFKVILEDYIFDVRIRLFLYALLASILLKNLSNCIDFYHFLDESHGAYGALPRHPFRRIY